MRNTIPEHHLNKYCVSPKLGVQKLHVITARTIFGQYSTNVERTQLKQTISVRFLQELKLGKMSMLIK